MILMMEVQSEGDGSVIHTYNLYINVRFVVPTPALIAWVI